MNRILMTGAAAALLAAPFTAAPARAQQNMIDSLYTAPAPQGQPGVMYMNPNFTHHDLGPVDSNRSHVSAVQAELQARGYRVKIDGVPGPETRAAVKKYQRKEHLRVDGQIGPQTSRALGLPWY